MRCTAYPGYRKLRRNMLKTQKPKKSIAATTKATKERKENHILHASPLPSPSLSVWSALGSSGQLSNNAPQRRTDGSLSNMHVDATKKVRSGWRTDTVRNSIAVGIIVGITAAAVAGGGLIGVGVAVVCGQRRAKNEM